MLSNCSANKLFYLCRSLVRFKLNKNVLYGVFCPEHALAPMARIFFGRRIKNPLDGLAE